MLLKIINSIIKYHFSAYNKMLNSCMNKKHKNVAHKIISWIPILGYVFKGSRLSISYSVSETKYNNLISFAGFSHGSDGVHSYVPPYSINIIPKAFLESLLHFNYWSRHGKAIRRGLLSFWVRFNAIFSRILKSKHN